MVFELFVNIHIPLEDVFDPSDQTFEILSIDIGNLHLIGSDPDGCISLLMVHDPQLSKILKSLAFSVLKDHLLHPVGDLDGLGLALKD